MSRLQKEALGEKKQKLDLKKYILCLQPAVVANIRDWFEKESDPALDTAASTLQFTVQDIHRHLGNILYRTFIGI